MSLFPTTIQNSQELVELLMRDSNFLVDRGWLDYSLIIFIIDWKKYCEKYNKDLKSVL